MLTTSTCAHIHTHTHSINSRRYADASVEFGGTQSLIDPVTLGPDSMEVHFNDLHTFLYPIHKLCIENVT